MKIYTYYQDIFEDQDELIDLWKFSWKRKGFTPIVLTLEDAAKHKDFDIYVQNFRNLFQRVTGRLLTRYGLCCFLRWLAYASLDVNEKKDNKFLVSDYDIINKSFLVDCYSTANSMRFLDSGCPCLVFGSHEQFRNIPDAFFDVTNERFEDLKNLRHYHDQEFFHNNFDPSINKDYLILWSRYNIVLSRNENDVQPYIPWEHQTAKVFHVSHENTDKIIQKYPEKYKNQTLSRSRINIIKEILNI